MDDPLEGPAAMRRNSTTMWRPQHTQTNAGARIPEECRKFSNRSKKDDDDDESDEDSTCTTMDANEILLQLNEDPCCNGNSAAGESSGAAGSLSNTVIIRPRLEEGDAKRQIELIFRTPACWRSETDQTHLLYLLQRFPGLASQHFDWDYNLFWQHGNEWSNPLCFLLASGANLETIQAVYNLFPAAISRPQGVNRDLPLHFACRFGITEDVLVFLVQRFPHAVMVSNSSGMLPIHCALGQKDIFPYGRFTHASLETVKILLQIYPQSLLKEEQQKLYTPLQIAFNHGYNFEVIDYIIDRLPQTINCFDLKAGCYHNTRFTVEFDWGKSILVSKLLPRLTRFHCEPTNWKKEGLIQLLTSLQQNSSVKHFKATNLTTRLLLDGDVINAIFRLFQCNKTLKSVGLSLKSDEGNVDTSPFFQCLDQGLQGNRAFHTLELENFPITYVGLNQFLSSSHAPPVLKMAAFTLFQSESEEVHWNRPGIGSHIEQVVISDFRFIPTTCKHFLALLHGLASMQKLTEFTLDLPQQNQLNITAPLAHLLKSKSLEALTIRGPQAQVEPLCASLQFNTTLQYLNFVAIAESTVHRAALANVLENNNASIEYVQLPQRRKNEDDKETRKIQFLTRLNSFGRGRVRESNATKRLLVTLLDDFAGRSEELQPEEELSIQFGLLRESPSLWCNSAPAEETLVSRRSRKRQRIL